MFGPIIAAPLAMPVIWTSRPADGHRCGRPACGRCRWSTCRGRRPPGGPRCAPSLHGRRGDALLDLVHRQERADHAGREHQGLVLLGAAGGGGQPGHLRGVVQAPLRRCRRWPRPSRSPRRGSGRWACGCDPRPPARRRPGSACTRPAAVAGVSDTTSVRSCFCGSRLIRQ